MTAPWPDDMQTRAIQMWKAGKSATAIGREIGVSRNAVTGKMTRLGINRNPGRRGKPAPKPVKAAPAIIHAVEQPFSGDRVMLMDLKPGDCKWPVSGWGADTLFCAQRRREGHPYCPDHCRIAYQNFECGDALGSSPSATASGAAPHGAPVTGRVDRNSSTASIRPGSFAGEG